MREVIVTGKTVEEATEAACQQLGLPREEVSIEILEMPVQRLFKRVPAKVRAQALEPQLTPSPPRSRWWSRSLFASRSLSLLPRSRRMRPRQRRRTQRASPWTRQPTPSWLLPWST